jgi:hypothetical protein
MSGWRRAILLVTGPLLAAGLSCTSATGPVSGGGSDLPNGTVMGTLYESDSSEAAAGEVVLRKVVVTSSGDSTAWEQSVEVESGGTYTFDSVAAGRYALVCFSADSSLAAIDQHIDKTTDTGSLSADLLLAPTVDLVGHIDLPPGFYYSRLRAFVPGTHAWSTVGSDRRYVLARMPQGSYDIAFAYDNTVNYLHVSLTADSADARVYVRTADFAVMNVMADSAESYYSSTCLHSYDIVPKSYSQGQHPPWYDSVSLDLVTYYRYSQGDTTVWVEDPMPGPREYDVILVGILFRGESGEVFLETFDGKWLLLVGALVATADLPVEPVVVAAREIDDGTGGFYYEVVEIAASPSRFFS